MILNNQNGLLLIRNDKLDERDWRSDDCYKLIFSAQGKGVYQTRRGDLIIDKEQFFVFNPIEEHKQIVVTGEKFLVELRPSFLKEVAEQLNYRIDDPEFAFLTYRHPQIQQWATFTREFIMLNKDSSSDIFLDHSLTQLAILVLNYGIGSHSTEFPKTSFKSILDHVMQTLKESCFDDWTLDDIADIAGLNKYQFAHLFKQTVGMTPYSWLQVCRLVRSQAILLKSRQSVLDIALQVGFKNIASYNALFKKIYGKTPTEFRTLYGDQ